MELGCCGNLRSFYVRLRLQAAVGNKLSVNWVRANGVLCCCSNLCSLVALRVIAAAQFQPLAWTFFVIRHPWLSTQRPTSVSAGLLTASLHRHLPALTLCSLTVTGSNGKLIVHKITQTSFKAACCPFC